MYNTCFTHVILAILNTARLYRTHSYTGDTVASPLYQPVPYYARIDSDSRHLNHLATIGTDILSILISCIFLLLQVLLTLKQLWFDFCSSIFRFFLPSLPGFYFGFRVWFYLQWSLLGHPNHVTHFIVLLPGIFLALPLLTASFQVFLHLLLGFGYVINGSIHQKSPTIIWFLTMTIEYIF